MEELFHEVADALGAELRGREVFTATIGAEDSEFVRFNRGAVRQAGTVSTRTLSVDWIEGRRHAAGSLSLSGERRVDRARIVRLVEELREKRAYLPEDPFLLYATEPRSTAYRGPNRLPGGGEAVGEIQAAAPGQDLVGIYASGGIHAGFANSFGQRNWYSTYSYNLDWSFYRTADKAVTANYAGFEWRRSDLERRMSAAGAELELVGRAARTIEPGRYRVYLAPAAFYDVLSLLGWGGFGLRAHKTKTTPLVRMVEEGARLDPRFSVTENTAEGVAPDFQEEGFRRPPVVPLIERGRYRECLASPRSAVEYGAETNGASAGEMPESLDVAPGQVPSDRILAELGRGIYVSNVWYLNYSDRAACRTTGMTRFATFWVENGRLAAPLSVMRFDDTIYRMLGENLIGLTAERELLFDPGSYGQRSTTTARLPGVLIDDLTFTL